MIEVNALDYGLVPAVNTASQAMLNAQAISAAFAVAPRVYLPDGQTFYTQQIVPPASAKKLFGNATLVMAGAGPGNGGGLLSLSGQSDFVGEDFIIEIDPTAYPRISGITLSSTIGVELRRVTIGVELRRVTTSGNCGIYTSSATSETLLDRCTVPSYAFRGIYFLTAASRVKVRDCKVIGGMAGSSHGINVVGDDIEIVGCTVNGTLGFGICVEESNHFSIHDNYTTGTAVEGINVTNSTWGQIRGNKCICFGSQDFGMSLSGQQGGQVAQVIVEGNVVDYPGKACLALAENTQWCKVIGNSFLSPFESVAARTQFPNDAAAVLLYGSACQFNEVSENLIRDLDGHMQWQVAEINFAGSGNPDYNKLGPHRGVPGSLGSVTKVGPNTQVFS